MFNESLTFEYYSYKVTKADVLVTGPRVNTGNSVG